MDEYTLNKARKTDLSTIDSRWRYVELGWRSEYHVIPLLQLDSRWRRNVLVW